MNTIAAIDEGTRQARLGVLYLFGNMRCSESNLKTLCNSLLDLADAGTAFYRGNIRGVDPRTSRVSIGNRSFDINRQGAADKIQDAFNWAIRKLVDWYDAAAGGHGANTQSIYLQVRSSLQDVLTGLVKGVARKALDSMFFDIPGWCESVVTAISSGVDAYRLNARGKTIAVLPGVPTTVVKGITQAMTRTALGNTYQAVRGAVSIAMKAATGLAQAVVDMVAQSIEILANAVWKVYEVLRLNQFCTEAKYHWETRGSALPWHMKINEFNAWYGDAVRHVPCIAAITLKSGLCGDSMHFLRMIDDSGSVLSEADYAAGMEYMDALKKAGEGYLSGIGYGFASQSLVVSSLVTLDGKPFRMSADMEKQAIRKLNTPRVP